MFQMFCLNGMEIESSFEGITIANYYEAEIDRLKKENERLRIKYAKIKKERSEITTEMISFRYNFLASLDRENKLKDLLNDRSNSPSFKEICERFNRASLQNFSMNQVRFLSAVANLGDAMEKSRWKLIETKPIDDFMWIHDFTTNSLTKAQKKITEQNAQIANLERSIANNFQIPKRYVMYTIIGTLGITWFYTQFFPLPCVVLK
ncbi:MAG TPA: hypothetical protein VHO47_02630 [Candidatus Babeliales bacterium]|nr:hypothetical protein [Candidatus Babeliales bacterium]